MYYFASDIHLGLGPAESSAARERLFTEWLETVSADADAIFIVGDMFDFWYEYKRVVPKGFTRLLGMLSALADRGITIHFFPGNHDMWVGDYLHRECGVTVHDTVWETCLYGKNVFITHGDDITAKEHGGLTRLMNWAFRSTGVRWLFSHLLHPDAALRLGHAWSSDSRKSKSVSHRFLGEDEFMIRFSRRYAATHDVDYFVFGHNHCSEIYPLDASTAAVFLGEWIENPTYATLDGTGQFKLHRFPNNRT